MLCEVVQVDEVSGIMHIHHDVTGHPGMNTTIKSIKEKYYWHGLSKDVKYYVSNPLYFIA